MEKPLIVREMIKLHLLNAFTGFLQIASID
jgi:hypothetical protein